MVAAGPSLIIGIAGGTASGKTTVANVLLERVGATSIAFLAHDAYYRDLHSLAPPQREQVNFDHPDSLETELMIRHLEALKRGESVDVPVYDFTVHARTR
ncbi:MAG: uridine kinase, partial [Anaerolineales bacterium]